MERMVASIARACEGLIARLYLSGQNLISYRELREMFGGGGYPPEVFEMFSRLPKTATREQVIQALREIANRNARGGEFTPTTARSNP